MDIIIMFILGMAIGTAIGSVVILQVVSKIYEEELKVDDYSLDKEENNICDYCVTNK